MFVYLSSLVLVFLLEKVIFEGKMKNASATPIFNIGQKFELGSYRPDQF